MAQRRASRSLAGVGAPGARRRLPQDFGTSTRDAGAACGTGRPARVHRIASAIAAARAGPTIMRRFSMRTGITISALLFSLSVSAATQQPLQVDTLSFSEPSTIAEIDTSNVKGQPARLAWSPDGTQLYLQMLDGQFGQAGAKSSHHAFDGTSGRRQELRAEPEWASAYWVTKSAQASPDGPAMKVELKSENRTASTVSTPMGGALARGGTDRRHGHRSRRRRGGCVRSSARPGALDVRPWRVGRRVRELRHRAGARHSAGVRAALK